MLSYARWNKSPLINFSLAPAARSTFSCTPSPTHTPFRLSHRRNFWSGYHPQVFIQVPSKLESRFIRYPSCVQLVLTDRIDCVSSDDRYSSASSESTQSYE